MVARIDYENKKKIYANYDLKFPHTKFDMEDMLSIASMEMDIEPKTYVIQEASKWFDARRSSRKENTLLSSFTGQSGKREIDIYYDDQFVTRIDRGLRDITDYSFISNCVRDANKNPLIFEYEMYNGYFLSPTGKTIRFPAQWMQQFYDMYDTRQPTFANYQLERQ